MSDASDISEDATAVVELMEVRSRRSAAGRRADRLRRSAGREGVTFFLSSAHESQLQYFQSRNEKVNHELGTRIEFTFVCRNYQFQAEQNKDNINFAGHHDWSVVGGNVDCVGIRLKKLYTKPV